MDIVKCPVPETNTYTQVSSIENILLAIYIPDMFTAKLGAIITSPYLRSLKNLN